MKSRWGGFKKGKKTFQNNWDGLKLPDQATEVSVPTFAPASVADFDYRTAQGIWNLNSTIQLKGRSPNPFADLESNGLSGLAGKIVSGSFRATISTGNIGSLPLSSPTLYTSISYSSLGDNYGFIAVGYFKPPTTGTYTFYTSSDDGSGVWVGNIASATSGRTTANAVLNNGMGLGQGNTKRSGTIALDAGTWYAIRIVHEEGNGGDNLTFSWAGPGISETTSLSTYFKTPANGGVMTGNYLQV